MGPWKRVGIVVKQGHSESGPLLARVVPRLEARGIEVLVEEESGAEAIGSVELVSREQVISRSDLIVVLGGDGTMLGVARDVGRRKTPVLGVNLGHLGFLAAVNPADVEDVLERVLEGSYRIDERARLEVVSEIRGEVARSDLVLNDAVLTKGTALARMIELQVRVDDRLVATYRSDGLIVATPTGATAYNLSAGGPLLDPKLPAILLTPICPHMLTQRPLVLADENWVGVRLLSSEDVTLTLDGQVGVTLHSGDRVRITRSAHPVRFLSAPGENHFETLRTKLGWGAL